MRALSPRLNKADYTAFCEMALFLLSKSPYNLYPDNYKHLKFGNACPLQRFLNLTGFKLPLE
jgi:hypothetical protein